MGNKGFEMVSIMKQERMKLRYLSNIELCMQMRDTGIKIIHDDSDIEDIKMAEVLYLQGSVDRNIYILGKSLSVEAANKIEKQL